MPQSPADSPTSSDQPWQGEWVERTSAFARVRVFLSRCFWPALLLTAIALFGSFIWLLTLAPKRTPLIVLNGGAYSWPLPPTEWTNEDVQGLSRLNRETITISGNESPVRSRQDFLSQLDASLLRAANHPKALPRIVFLNLHGVSDPSDNRVYLIPPGGSPTDADTWVRLEEVLDRLESVDSQRKTLLVLDCQHMAFNWNLALKENRFSDSVTEHVQSRFETSTTSQNTAVLMSCGGDEIVHSSGHLRGSVFGHFFRSGLAGAADQSGDGWVSLKELEQYVTDSVSSWVLRHRGQQQNPQLLTALGNTNFDLARSLNQAALDRLVSVDSSQPLTSIPNERLNGLWENYEHFRDERLYETEPIAFRNFEHQLLSLEQLARAGSGYRDESLSLASDLDDAFSTVKKRLAAARRFPDVQHAFSIVQGRPTGYPSSLKMHTTPLAMMLGSESPESMVAVNAALTEFEKQPSKQTLLAVTRRYKSLGKSGYATGQFFRMLNRYQTPRLWDRSGTIARLTQLQQTIHELEAYSKSDGILADGRRHGWTRLLLKDVDEARRDAEDWAFLSDDAEFDLRVRALETQLTECRQRIELLHKAFQTSDEAFATQGYLGRWLATSQHSAFHADDAAVRASFVEMLEESIRLAQTLSASIVSEASNAWDPLLVDADAVRAHLDELNRHLERRSRWLIEQSRLDDPSVLEPMLALSTCPHLDLPLRKQLRVTHDDLAKRLFEQGGNDPSTLAMENDAGVVKNVATWSRHPLDVMLPHDGEQPWTERLNHFVDDIQSKLTTADSGSSIQSKYETQVVQANRLRAAAPIWFPRRESDAIAQLRTSNLQLLLMWHANRAIEDFWGPAGRGEPFYDVAASDYCEAASALGRSETPEEEVSNALALLDSTRTFLPNWLATSTGPGIRIDANDQIRSELTVLSNTPTGFSAPTGTAAVTVRGEEASLQLARVEPSDAVTLPTIGGHYTMTLPRSVAEFGDQLVAQAMFRGHEYGRPLKLAKLGGQRVHVVANEPPSSTLTVSDQWDGASIGFVLDGSASMGEELEEGKTKLDVAKSALSKLLRQIALRGNTRVGVRVFGHRVGWSTTQPVQALRRPGIGELSEDVMPSRDVEALLQLRPFGIPQMRQLEAQVANVKPWGQSPLYLAMDQALAEFGEAHAKTKRHLIVITDGENYQFSLPSDSNFRPTAAQDVIGRADEVGVPIHILGLGVDRAQEPHATSEFEQLGRDSGGGFETLSSATDLAGTLERLLLSPSYSLQSIDKPQRPVHETRLGEEVALQIGPDSPERFEVRVDHPEQEITQMVALEGGESIQLYVEDERLFAYAYDQDVVHQVKLSAAHGDETHLVFRIHRPSRLASGDAVFRLSWQTSDAAIDQRWKPTERPESYWIELQPLDDQSREIGPSYVFYDREFEDGAPVPLVKLTAEDWPEKATRVGVRAWANPLLLESLSLQAPQQPVESTGIREVIAFDPSQAEPIVLPSQAFVRMESFSADSSNTRHRLIVRFDDPSVAVSSIKIQSQGDSSKPDQILRQFDQENGIAVHTFTFSENASVPENYLITDRSTETQMAWSISDNPIEVDVPEPGGLLPLGVSASQDQLTR